MKQRTKDKLERIDAGHDWQAGQTRSGGGTVYHSTDTCRFCGLTRSYYSDRQNGVEEEWTFPMPLREVPDTCEES